MLPDLENKRKEEIVADILGLNDLERSIYFYLCGDELTVKDLVDLTGRTRSVVQRALQSLLKKNMIVREGRINKTVYYVYTALPFEKIKDVVKNYLNTWYQIALKRLE